MKTSIVLLSILQSLFIVMLIEGSIYLGMWLIKITPNERFYTVIEISTTLFFITLLLNILFGFRFKEK